MKLKMIPALLLCLCATLLFSVALGENVTLSVDDQVFTAPSDAVEIDLGEMSLPDTDEAYAALDSFLRRLPNVKHVDMFSTDIPQNRLEALAESFPQIEFGWTIYIPCKNDLRPDRGPHRLRTDQTAFSTLHNISCTSHNEDVWRVLKYCKNLEALDIGHNNTLKDLSFLYDLPKLKVLVVSFNMSQKGDETPLDITPIGSLKELQYLEICKSNVHDISPLANCTHLVDLNLGTNRVMDLSPLYCLKSLRRLFVFACNNRSGKAIPQEMLAPLKEALPDCMIDNRSINTGGPWKKHERYQTLVKMFGYTTKTVVTHQEYIPFDSLD